MPSGREVRPVGLQELRACKKAISSRRTARRQGGAVLLNLADDRAPIELLEGMRGATGRDVQHRWLGCAHAPTIQRGFGPRWLYAPAGSCREGASFGGASL